MFSEIDDIVYILEDHGYEDIVDRISDRDDFNIHPASKNDVGTLDKNKRILCDILNISYTTPNDVLLSTIKERI